MGRIDKRALVITGGSVVAPGFRRVVRDIGPFDIVIAADSGVDSALALGVVPDVALGDFDSISAAGRTHLETSGARVIVSPIDKDLTDTELALAHLLDIDATQAVLLSPGGGRLDHAHGVLSALSNPLLAGINLEAIIGTAHVTVLHGRTSRTIPRRGSHLAALHAMNGPARCVHTAGLRWNLAGEDLAPWVARGVSNEMTADEAAITLEAGVLFVVQPLAHGDSSPIDHTPNNEGELS